MKRLCSLTLVLLLCVNARAQTPGTVTYPTTIDTPDALFRASDDARSVLTDNVNSSDATFHVTSATSFPATGAFVIDNEIAYYTGKTSNTLTGVVRGRSGTTAISHTAGAAVRGAIIAAMHNALAGQVIAVETKVGAGSSTPDAGKVLKGTTPGASEWSPLVESDIPSLDAAKIATGRLDAARLPATVNATQVRGVQVSATPPVDGDSLVFDEASNAYSPRAVSSSPGTSPLLTGISNYWKLEEGGSTPRADSAGASPLTPSSGLAAVGTTSGKIGLGQPLYSPESRYLYAADSPALSTGDISFTVSAWVYLDPSGQSSSNPGIVDKWGAVDANREYYLLYDSTGALGGTANRFVFAVMAGTTKTQVVSSFVPTTGVMYHVLAWRDKVAGTISIRVNGGTIDSAAQSGAVNDGAAQLQVGAINSADALTGRIDEVGFWKRALTSSERAKLYNAGNGLQYDFVDTGAIVSRTYNYSIKDDFYASGSDQATTGSISSSSNSLTVASAIDFAKHEGVLVAGAGGADLVTTITNISGTTLTLADAAATTVSGVLVMHDDSKAVQDSLDRCAGDGGCYVDWEDGTYNINRALNSDCNAILCYPFANGAAAAYTVVWNGRFVTRTSPKALPTKGVIIKSTRVAGAGTYPAMISAAPYSDTAAGYPTVFNYVFPEMHNFAFVTATDPSLSVINWHNAIGAQAKNLQFFAGADSATIAAGSAPTHSVWAMLLPGENNHTQVRVTDASGYGFYNGITFAEHTILDHVVFSLCKLGLQREGGGHPATIYSADVEACNRSYNATGSGFTYAFNFTMEIDTSGSWYSATTNHWIDDLTGTARGDMNFRWTNGGTPGSTLPQRTGFQFTRLRDGQSGTTKEVGTP
jgi:hypothetical protein